MDKKFKLDLKDRRILFELDLNSRQPASIIAKKVGLSTEVTNYRLKRLEKKKIITHFQTIINYSKLDSLQFKLCLSFSHITSEELIKSLKELDKIEEVKWAASCTGPWDLIISYATKTFTEINLLKEKTLSIFKDKINEKAVSILVEANTFTRNYLLDKEQEIISKTIMKEEAPKAPTELDELDLGIIKMLVKNSRAGILQIAQELNTTARIINYRIKNLEKKKIIEGYKIAINYENLGIQFYKTFVYLDNPNREEIKKFKIYLKNHENIIHDAIVLANWDFEPEFEVSSEQEFNKILTKMKDQFSSIIKNVEVITITKEHKFEYF